MSKSKIPATVLRSTLTNNTSNGPVGQPVPRVEGGAKVRGLTKYSADVERAGVLWGKVLRSPFPHARILTIDTSRACGQPGVKAVITGRDVSPRLVGASLKDMPVLARDVVRYVGEAVAAVAAVGRNLLAAQPPQKELKSLVTCKALISDRMVFCAINYLFWPTFRWIWIAAPLRRISMLRQVNEELTFYTA